MNTTAAAAEDRQAMHSDAPKLDPDVLATVIDETARRVEARAARPSPVHLRNWEEIERFAEKAARSGMVPKDYIGQAGRDCDRRADGIRTRTSPDAVGAEYRSHQRAPGDLG